MDFSARLSLPPLPLRTNSDSALHTSALSTKPQDPYGGGGQSAWPASYVGKTRRPEASHFCTVLFCPRGVGGREKLTPCAFPWLVFPGEQLLAGEVCVCSWWDESGPSLPPLPLQVLRGVSRPSDFTAHSPIVRSSSVLWGLVAAF